MLFTGFNLKTKGLVFPVHVLKHRKNPNVPMIVMINEFDLAMKYSKEEHDPQEISCHAQDKTEMATF